LIQDLWLINEAVIPLHPIILNPYTLLAQILSKAQYYSVLDLKDIFFCIPKSKVFSVKINVFCVSLHKLCMSEMVNLLKTKS
jgi:hypothetical protein